MLNVSKEEKAGIEVLKVLAECIRELKEVPEGVLYAQIMSMMDLPTFAKCIQMLCVLKIVERTSHHTIKWIDK